MIILDTDSLSILERKTGQPYLTLKRNLVAFDPEMIATTIVTFDEQMRGWMAFAARSRDTADLILAYSRMESFLDTFRSIPVLPFTPDAGIAYDDLRRQKIRVGTMDLRIASIALAKDAILVSRNLVDFERIPGLTVEDWTRENYIN